MNANTGGHDHRDEKVFAEIQQRHGGRQGDHGDRQAGGPIGGASFWIEDCQSEEVRPVRFSYQFRTLYNSELAERN